MEAHGQQGPAPQDGEDQQQPEGPGELSDCKELDAADIVRRRWLRHPGVT